MIRQPFLSVVIPSYNEQANLKRDVLSGVISYLEQQSYSWEIILSDDGSTDGTIKQLEDFASKHNFTKVVKNPHRGKGPTVISGMLNAKGDWRLFTDFDQSTPINEIEKLLAFIHSHQVIIGSREIPGALRDKEPFYRHLMGRGFNLLVQLLAVRGVFDSQCGFKLFSKKATEDLFQRVRIYAPTRERADAFTGAFDVELLFLARKLGYQIKEVPILWQHHATNRVSPVKDSLRMFFDICKIRVSYLFNKYHTQ